MGSQFRSEKIFLVICVTGWLMVRLWWNNKWATWDSSYIYFSFLLNSFFLKCFGSHIFHKSQEKSLSCSYWRLGQLMLEFWVFLSHAEMSWNMKKFREINVTFAKKITEREKISWKKEFTHTALMAVLKLYRPMTPWNVLKLYTYLM